MKRADCIKALYPELQDKLVVTIMGASAQELYDLGHCEGFFYLEHAMGLASSIGLGLALNLPHEKIVVMDGDGSVLMNLGGLATLARYRPPNMVHLIFDNGSNDGNGGFGGGGHRNASGCAVEGNWDNAESGFCRRPDWESARWSGTRRSNHDAICQSPRIQRCRRLTSAL